MRAAQRRGVDMRSRPEMGSSGANVRFEYTDEKKRCHYMRKESAVFTSSHSKLFKRRIAD